MKIKIIILLTLVSCAVLSACRRVTPYIPFDQYNRLYMAPVINDIDVKRASEGVYKLYIREIDTTFSRKKMLYYTTQNTAKQARNTDSLYLYFIDDYRFYYTKNKADSIDIRTGLNKKSKIGTYRLNINPQDSVVYVNLILADARVKDGQNYEYADMIFKLKGDTLDFLTAYFPIRYQPRDNSAANQPPFSPKVIEQDADKIYHSGLKTFESTGMGFHAQWHFSAKKILTKINGQEFDNVIYSVMERENYLIRTYTLKGLPVYKEEIHGNRTKNILFSW